MKILKYLLALICVCALSAPSQAGEIVLDAVEAVNAPALFGENEVQVEALGYYIDGGGLETSGGGVGVGYFFTYNIGVRAQAIWGTADSSTLRMYNADLVYRYPIEHLGLAPYAYIGGGAGELDNNGTVGVFRAGAGIEWRVTPGLGFFGEADYTWTESGSRSDFPRAGFGVRLNF